MTVEELQIIVDASIEKAVKEFEKLLPSIKKEINKIQKEFNNADIKDITAKVDMNALKTQMKEAKKTIKDVFNPNDTNGMKINGVEQITKKIKGFAQDIGTYTGKINFNGLKKKVKEADKIFAGFKSKEEAGNVDDLKIKGITHIGKFSTKKYTFKGVEPRNQVIEVPKPPENRFNREFEAKFNRKNTNNIKIEPSRQSMSIWDTLKNKIKQIKPAIEQAKSSSKGLSTTMSKLPSITNKITNNIKNMGLGMKRGLRHVLKYAGALFSLRGIYSILSSSAQSWLSSQNLGAKQLSANIEYMKYAMGSALAPVIEYVVNLAYQLMKAIQNLVYAFSGINIFAKATASSMKSTASSAKDASKSLAGVHNEINNVSDNNSGSGTTMPDFDLSQMDNTPNNILDAIKNGNWEEVGAVVGEKINGALEKIPWDKIQNTSRNIGTNIASFLNGAIKTTNWLETGNTFAQGLNTIIYFGYSFVTTFDWKQFGRAIGDNVNGLFSNVDWKTASRTLSEGVKGTLSTISTAINETDWVQIGKDIGTFLINIDWNGTFQGLEDVIANAIIALIGSAWGLVSEIGTQDIQINWESMWKKLQQTTDFQMGVVDDILNIGAKKMLENMGLSQDEANEMWNNKWQIAGQYLSENWENFKSTIKTKTDEMKENISSFATNSKDAVVNKFSEMKTSMFDNAIEIKDGISQKFQEAYNNIKNTFKNIDNFFGETWRKHKEHIFKFGNIDRKCYFRFC